MSVEFPLSPTDSGPPSSSTSSSFGSMNDSNLPAEKMEQLIRKLRSENKQLQLRVLGVNELARLLQDRTEKVKVLEDKNKRLEIAVVRLENRCANLEQKLRAEGGGTSGPKSMQPPSIPGPSRQILEALMKENSELKKALNNMQKKGVSGYLEAVKTTQLEEVIEQQKQELDFLRSQVNMLTTTPLPQTHTGAHTEESQSGDSAGGDAGSPGTLRRQLIKMQHSLKVKDRFCSLLSDQVSSLQDRLRQMKLDDATDQASDQEPNSAELQGGPAKSIEKLEEELIQKKKELESRYDHIIKEQKETLQKERQEHMTVVEKLQRSEQEMKRLSRELDALDKRCEDLQFHNHTLLDDKKQLQETLDQLKAAGSKGNEDGGLERELRELQDSLHQKVMEHSEELRNKDREMQQLRMVLEDTEYKYVIAHSKLSEIEKEHEQHMTDLKDKLEYKDIDVTAKQNEIEDLKQNLRQMQMEMSSLRSKPNPQAPHVVYPRDIQSMQSILPLISHDNMQNVVAAKDGVGHTDPTVTRPPHSPSPRCDTVKHETVYHMALLSRDPDVKEPGQSAQQPPPAQSQHGTTQHPSSLPFRSQNPPPRRPSPSPSSATPHQLPPQMPPHPVPGRRSPISPHFSQTAPPPPRSVPQPLYSAPPPATTPYHLSATPMGYQQQLQHRHPLPQPTFDPSMMPGGHPQQGQFPGYGQGGGRTPQSGSSLPPGTGRPRPPIDNDPHGLPPHGFHGDRSQGEHRHGDPSSSAHHQHHTQRRN